MCTLNVGFLFYFTRCQESHRPDTFLFLSVSLLVCVLSLNVFNDRSDVAPLAVQAFPVLYEKKTY